MKNIHNEISDDTQKIENEIHFINNQLIFLKEQDEHLKYIKDVLRLIDFFKENDFRKIISIKYEQEIGNRSTIAIFTINLDNKVLSAKKLAPFAMYGHPSWEDQDIIALHGFLNLFEKNDKTIKIFGRDFLNNLSFEKLKNELQEKSKKIEKFNDLYDYAKKISKNLSKRA